MNKIMPNFFSSETENLQLVSNVKEVLKRLSKFMQVVVLTNLPHKDKDKREKALRNNNIEFPVITNSGLKGPAVKKILENKNQKSFFIDDMPMNIDSVAKDSPKTICIHFIQDKRINKLMPTPKSAKIKSANWFDVENFILDNLKDDKNRNT
jgi:hypothetical protein|tara:strand:+ start:3182 stop:3637 length:456 start_codon:yes stop_codon:yes gene_type:complete